MMKAPYRNAIKTKILIRETVISLLSKNKTMNDITVSDVVEAANINRGTFYNHYSSPIEVLEEMKNELMDSLSEGLKVANLNRNLDAFIDFIIQHCRENENDYRKIIKALPMSTIDDLKQKFILELEKMNFNIDDITIRILVNGIVGLYLDYMKGTIQISYEELSIKLKKFLHHCIDA